MILYTEFIGENYRITLSCIIFSVKICGICGRKNIILLTSNSLNCYLSMFYNSPPAWWWIEVPNWGWFIPLWDNTFQGLCFTACSNKSIMMINSYKPFIFLRNKIKLIIMVKFSYKWEYRGLSSLHKTKTYHSEIP